ncbi:MAG: CotH protein [Firmicutes bacterium ADurb.Bin419]|nr:MAG: CotH protein [Firmicutes bacterium ADurb.Bin419]
MKKKLSVVASALIVSVLATGITGWNCNEKVFASEAVNVTAVAAEETEITQLEMPIVSINTISGSEISSTEDYIGAKISIINAEGTYEMTDMDTTIKLRGSSSMYAEKQSYKIKFEDKQNLLKIGDGKGKPWLLIANFSDHSLLRNFTAYSFGDKLTGLAYTPNCRSVEVYVNGEYQGVYLLCEDITLIKTVWQLQKSRIKLKKTAIFWK